MSFNTASPYGQNDVVLWQRAASATCSGGLKIKGHWLGAYDISSCCVFAELDV